MNSNLIYLFFVVSSFYSCSIQNLSTQKLVGEYRHDVIYGIGSFLELSNDSTFVFNWQQGLILGETLGKWRYEKNGIFLTSERQPEKVKSDYIVKDTLFSKNNSNDTLWVKLTDIQGDILPFAICNIFKRKKDTIHSESTNINGELAIPLKKITKAKNIHFTYLGFLKANIAVKQITSNSIVVKMKQENNPYVYFTNERWKIKAGRLCDPRFKRNKIHNKCYTKIKNGT